jgi:inorganic triphosphatase YgiF
VEEIEVELVLPKLPEPARVMAGLAELFGLEHFSRGMTSTLDRMLDSDDFALLAQGHSLRVRQKLDNVYSGNEYRLTYKCPLREHERLFIRAEHKLKLAEPDFDAVLTMLNSISSGLAGERLLPALHISELAHESYIGPKGGRVSVSLDQCHYSLPGSGAEAGEGTREIVLELEAQGVEEERILAASDWVASELGGREAAESKYARGLRLLGRL